MKKLKAISDLHLASPANREALHELPAFKNDWLIVAGDVAERFDHVRLAFETLAGKFAKVFWVPGNHDLWSIPEPGGGPALTGETRYRALVDCARDYGIVTPEDPFETWDGPGGPHVIAPLFLLYDYSFRPDHVERNEVVDWAREQGAVCADELYLNPAPWDSRDDWCSNRCEEAERRLAEVPDSAHTILVNHYPLRSDLIHIPPRATLHALVRYPADGGLAPALQRQGRHFRALAHAPHRLARRLAFRGSVSRLSAPVGPEQGHGVLSPRYPAGITPAASGARAAKIV